MNDRKQSSLVKAGALARLALLALLAGACARERAREAPRPVYEGDVAHLLELRCGGCHGEQDAGGGYRVDGYLRTLACTPSQPNTPAVQRPIADVGVDAGADAGTSTEAPLLAALERDDHHELLDDAERARLATWIAADAPLRDHGAHTPGILNPRSPQWHGRLAAREHFAPLRDAKHPEACGRCHEGAPVTPRGIEHPADGAPACTSCHDQPDGVLACSSCHGDGARRAFPPRDACLFDDAGGEDAHAVHVGRTELQASALPCAACHPAADATLSGTHADGTLDVRLDPTLAGDDAHFDPDGRHCATYCHDHDGARSKPRFDEPGPMTCGDCHGAPPEDHFAGECDQCHAEPNADGSALRATVLHLDGHVDVGPANAKGSACGTCHGRGEDPMPQTPSHQLHRAPLLTEPIACGECHAVPDQVTSEGHLDLGERTPPDLVFGPRARARSRTPSYEAGTCRDVACHGAGLAEGIERALRWDERASSTCSGCHGLPPPAPHPQDVSCAAVACHGAEVRSGSPGPGITEAGRAQHIDGTIDRGAR